MKKNQANMTNTLGPNPAQRVYAISRVWVILALALVFPFLGANNYLLHMANVSMMFAILTISLNVLSGFTGLMSVGHIAFFGIGAYSTAILTTTYGMPIWLGFIAAGVISALFSLLLGIPTMRLKGMYFSVATLAFGEIIYQIIKNWESVTKGTKGITKIPEITIFGFSFKSYDRFYYLMLLGLVVVIVLTYNLKNSRAGRAMLAIRANDIAAYKKKWGDQIGFDLFVTPEPGCGKDGVIRAVRELVDTYGAGGGLYSSVFSNDPETLWYGASELFYYSREKYDAEREGSAQA